MFNFILISFTWSNEAAKCLRPNWMRGTQFPFRTFRGRSGKVFRGWRVRRRGRPDQSRRRKWSHERKVSRRCICYEKVECDWKLEHRSKLGLFLRNEIDLPYKLRRASLYFCFWIDRTIHKYLSHFILRVKSFNYWNWHFTSKSSQLL